MVVYRSVERMERKVKARDVEMAKAMAVEENLKK